MNSARQVVVIGSGAAGMAAAVAAASQGAAVSILERADKLGGTTAFSGGVIWIPANPWATAAGIDDSPEEALRYIRAVRMGDADERLAEAYVANGVRVVHGIEAASTLRWNLVGAPDFHPELDGGKPAGGRCLEIDSIAIGVDTLNQVRTNPYGAPPASAREVGAGVDAAEIERRNQAGISARGRGLIGGMTLSAREFGATIRTGVRAARLITHDGAVVGVEAGGERFDGQVIIASGGFERDPALVRSFLRGPMLAPASPPTNDGDGLRMGMSVGAALGNMAEAWWAPGTVVPGDTLDGQQFYRMLLGDRAAPGFVIVDGTGRRFVNEITNYNDFGRSMHATNYADYSSPRVPSWFICDARRRRAAPIATLKPTDPDPDWLSRADTLEQLAAAIGLPPRTLRETVERYNGLAATGADPDFGRGASAYDFFASGKLSAADQLRPLSDPPFYALQVVPGCVGTKGGLKTDAHGQVQRADGTGPIPGLFAAGNSAANPFGAGDPAGGATIGTALVFGWLAGEAAAAALS